MISFWGRFFFSPNLFLTKYYFQLHQICACSVPASLCAPASLCPGSGTFYTPNNRQGQRRAREGWSIREPRTATARGKCKTFFAFSDPPCRWQLLSEPHLKRVNRNQSPVTGPCLSAQADIMGKSENSDNLERSCFLHFNFPTLD